MPEPNATTIIIEDEPAIMRFLRTTLRSHGHTLYEAADGWSNVIAELPPDALLARVDSATYGNFVKVQTPEGLRGYVSLSAPVRLSEASGVSRPDGAPGPSQ